MTDSRPHVRRAFSALRARLPFGRTRRLEAELRVERQRITQLEAEIDELRRDSLRIAELVDLVEERLTP